MKRIDMIMKKLNYNQRTDKNEEDEQCIAMHCSKIIKKDGFDFKSSTGTNEEHVQLNGSVNYQCGPDNYLDISTNTQCVTPQSSPLRTMSPETERIYDILSKNLDDDELFNVSTSPSTLTTVTTQETALNICLDHSEIESENCQPAPFVEPAAIIPEDDNYLDSPINLPSNISIPPPSYSPLTPLVRNLNKKPNAPGVICYQSDDNENTTANEEEMLNFLNNSDDSVQDPNYVDECVVNESTESDVTVAPDEETGNNSKGRPKRGRKLKYKYNRSEQKRRKYQNLSYCTKNKLVKPKEFVDYQCSCKKKCGELVSKEIREQEFLKFCHLGSYVAQVLYIVANVSESKKKRSSTTVSSPSKSKPREFNRDYKIKGISVCRDMFCKTLQVTPQKITVSLKKMRDGANIKDERGKSGGWNKLDKEHFDFIVEIIQKLPKYISHYGRGKNDDVKYLQPGMTVRKIYDLYIKEYKDKYGSEANCVSFNTVQKIFTEKFNLRCKGLKKDTCNRCDSFTIKLNDTVNSLKKEEIQLEKEKHLKKAQSLRKQMNEDFEKARNFKEIECITFDLEKTLPLPRIPTNVIFYKRQLWVYNFGVHSASNDVGHCFVWAEGEAGRGAQEVGSCLISYIKNELPSDVTQLILWSDCAGGQNRNIKVVLMLKAILNSHPNLKTISFRFLESGHTFLPNDNDFAKIETRLKQHQRIYTIEEYMEVMKNCKKVNPLKVHKMKNIDFVGCKDLEKKIVNRKIFTDKSKVNWLITKEILLKKEQLYSIYMRTTLEEPYKELNLQKKMKGNIYEISDKDLIPLWPVGKEINQNKLNDLESIYHLIPADCIEFYKRLKGTNSITDDLEGLGEPDFEIEDEDET